jgi:hypothetical protein
MEEGTVRMAAQMYALVAEMESIKAEIEGMKSENKTRESQGYSMAYGDESFCDMSNKLDDIACRLRKEI